MLFSQVFALSLAQYQEVSTRTCETLRGFVHSKHYTCHYSRTWRFVIMVAKPNCPRNSCGHGLQLLTDISVELLLHCIFMRKERSYICSLRSSHLSYTTVTLLFYKRFDLATESIGRSIGFPRQIKTYCFKLHAANITVFS